MISILSEATIFYKKNLCAYVLNRKQIDLSNTLIRENPCHSWLKKNYVFQIKTANL